MDERFISAGEGLLFNLQVLRGLAALGVVFYHTDFRLAGDWHTDFSGVAIFFVISGFIMCFITRDTADEFLKMRLIRIVPIYWLCTFALVFLMFRFAVFKPSTWLTAPAWRTEEPLWSYVGRSLLFLPSEKFPILGVGWTLNFEMYFYVVFALALWINRLLAPLIVAAFLIAVFYSDGTVCTLFVCHYYSHGYIHFFLVGIGIYYVWKFTAPHMPKTPTILIAVLMIAICYGSQFVHPWWSPVAEPFLNWSPAIVVVSALFAETAGAVVRWKPLLLVGDASYAIYLTHTILFETIRMIERWIPFPNPKQNIGAMLTYVGAALAVGIAVHLFVEKPTLRIVRFALSSSRKTSKQIVLEPR